MSSRSPLCLSGRDQLSPLASAPRSRSPKSRGNCCADRKLVRKDTGIKDHCDRVRRHTDEENAIRQRLEQLNLTTAFNEDEEQDDEGVESETASNGSCSEAITDLKVEDEEDSTRGKKCSLSSSGIESAESAEEEESDSFPAHNPRSSKAPFKLTRKDTGLKDHENKERRRSQEAVDTKERLASCHGGSDILEEEEEEEEGDSLPTDNPSTSKAPIKFTRKDTGLKDHENKEQRRSQEAVDTKERLASCHGGTDILEEEEEEEEA